MERLVAGISGIDRGAILPMVATWVFDLVLALLISGALASLCIALAGHESDWAPVLRAGCGFGAAAGIAALLVGTPRGVWRYASSGDVSRLARAGALSLFLFVPILAVCISVDGLKMWPVILAAPALTVMLIFTRAIGRSMLSGDVLAALNKQLHGAPLVVLIGDTDIAAGMVSAARKLNPRPWRPIAIIDLSARAHGRAIAGVKVLHPRRLGAEITAARRSGGNPQLVLALPHSDPVALDFALSAAAETGAPILRSAMNGESRTILAGLHYSDLLPRKPRQLDPGYSRALVRNRVVLITGAGGTIGSELSRQAAQFGAAKLVLYDSSEYNLFRTEADIAALGVESVPVLGDVRDPEHLNQVMQQFRPQVVLHAAALKHVPLMEHNPAEAVLTNIMGLIQTLEAADMCGATEFVFISTDKAVEPASVMGATKRVGELLLSAWQPASHGPCVLGTAFVRFGNVLGSNGSVAETFERQIRAGGPVTVTHKDMERYFMTAPEAGGLVLSAAALARNGEGSKGFLLDMGEPVRVETLARRMIQLVGGAPNATIPIVYQGLRRGEKLQEKLHYSFESLSVTEVDGVLSLQFPRRDSEILLREIRGLISAARRRDDATVTRLLTQLVGRGDPAPGSPYDDVVETMRPGGAAVQAAE